MSFSLLSLFSWVEKGQVKVRTWGIMHIPECSHRRVSCVCLQKNKSIEKRHSVTPSQVTWQYDNYMEDKPLSLITFWGLGFVPLTLMCSTVHCTTPLSKEEKSDDMWNQRECPGLLRTMYSLFIWRFCRYSMLNLLRTWINCCNMAKGFVVRGCVFNFLQSANCYKIAGWLLASPFSGPPFLNCKAINFKTVAQSPPCSFVIWIKWDDVYGKLLCKS